MGKEEDKKEPSPDPIGDDESQAREMFSEWFENSLEGDEEGKEEPSQDTVQENARDKPRWPWWQSLPGAQQVMIVVALITLFGVVLGCIATLMVPIIAEWAENYFANTQVSPTAIVSPSSTDLHGILVTQEIITPNRAELSPTLIQSPLSIITPSITSKPNTQIPKEPLPPSETPTPTPKPKDAILNLINAEREAVLTKNMDLIQTIFTADATKTDASSSQSVNAIQDYAEDFDKEDHLEITHANFKFDIEDDIATVTNDSCGSLIDRKKAPGEQRTVYRCVQCDKWTFERDNKGRWWITSFTYGLSPSAPSQRYTFEYANNGCWDVRYVEGEAQGEKPTHTAEKACEGSGSLQFEFDLGSLSTHQAQTIRYNMPFAGQASAWVYAPSDAPADLEAGFFAMELDHDPWNYHPADQMSQLVPGQCTQISWNIDASGWVWPLHLLGIEVRQANGGAWEGYVLIDDVTIESQ